MKDVANEKSASAFIMNSRMDSRFFVMKLSLLKEARFLRRVITCPFDPFLANKSFNWNGIANVLLFVGFCILRVVLAVFGALFGLFTLITWPARRLFEVSEIIRSGVNVRLTPRPPQSGQAP